MWNVNLREIFFLCTFLRTNPIVVLLAEKPYFNIQIAMASIFLKSQVNE